MKASSTTVQTERPAAGRQIAVPGVRYHRPSFRWSDIWKAPLHDFPIRDEVLYQYLPLSPDMDVLEVGPGSGFTAFRLARQVRHLTSVDIAANNIEQLRGALKDVPNLRFVCADVCAPGLAESLGSRFDAAFALEVFELLPDPAACLTNLAGVLGRGGRLLIQFPNYPPPRSPGPTCFCTREEFDRLVRRAGFASWELYALKLGPYAEVLFRTLHERPLKLYRRLRDGNGSASPRTYDRTWAFQHRKRLERYRCLLHGAWTVLFAGVRLGGDCFERTLLRDQILNHNLLLVAQR